MGNINGHDGQVRPSWLRMRLAEPDTAKRICLIDAAPAGDARLVPGAGRLDVEALTAGGRIPPAAEFEAAVRRVGLTSYDQVVVYDDGGLLRAELLQLLFKFYGYDDVCVLEGGAAAYAALADMAPALGTREPGTWQAPAPAGQPHYRAALEARMKRRR
jgi:3-mercaptopyruvate sulfurtransferase SseA